MRLSAHQGSREIGQVTIDTSIELGRGATATIYKAQFDGRTFAAKIYNAEKMSNISKVEAMLSNQPSSVSIQFAGTTYPQLAWPSALLKSDQGQPIGYLMQLVDLQESFPLDYYYDKALFKKLNAPDEIALSYKLEIARNLSSIIADLHKHEHYFVDLKPQNIRVFRRTHIVTLVDCDGFSVKSETGDRFPAELISTDYISPEAFINQTSPKELSEDQDRYALAVILFQLLNHGTHPFQGILQKDDGPNTNDEKAAAGLYPHGVIQNLNILPRPQSTHIFWDNKTRTLFDKAFIGGQNERPSAIEWADHFDKLLSEKALVRCDKEPLNLAHMRFKNKECPTCYLQALEISNEKQTTPILLKPEKNQSSKTVAAIFAYIILIGIVASIFIKTPNKEQEETEVDKAAQSTSILTPQEPPKGETTADLGTDLSKRKYKVRAPNGRLYEFTGPANASDQELIEYASLLYEEDEAKRTQNEQQGHSYQSAINPPTEAVKLVTEGWSYMSPTSSIHDYQKALELNKKAYYMGHMEGAINIGLLYENGWGLKKDLFTALKWYEAAVLNDFHSAQAELGIARILLTSALNNQSLLTVNEYNQYLMTVNEWLKKASIQAKHPAWTKNKVEHLNEVMRLRSILIDNYHVWARNN